MTYWLLFVQSSLVFAPELLPVSDPVLHLAARYRICVWGCCGQFPSGVSCGEMWGPEVFVLIFNKSRQPMQRCELGLDGCACATHTQLEAARGWDG